MTLWDGLKSQNLEQIIVLGATNRPFDLDDAILRRFSRRIRVDLPTKEERKQILKVILKDENYTCSIDTIAEKTDGYSGCDLHNLCCTAAMRPLREFIKKEKEMKKKIEEYTAEGKELDDEMKQYVEITTEKAKELVRPMNDEDIQECLSTMNPSTNKESPDLVEIRNWNEQFGESKTGKKEFLPYFI